MRITFGFPFLTWYHNIPFEKMLNLIEQQFMRRALYPVDDQQVHISPCGCSRVTLISLI